MEAWQSQDEFGRASSPKPDRPRVFCASLADVFEDWQGPMVDSQGSKVNADRNGMAIGDGGLIPGDRDLTMGDVRRRLFALIDATPNLDWLLVTKRPENIARMTPRYCPDGIAGCEALHGPRPNVWLGVSVENQKAADERIPHLLRTPAAVRFLSCEPLLGPVDLEAVTHTVQPGYFGDTFRPIHRPGTAEQIASLSPYPGVDWVIVGGESGPSARPMHPVWALSLLTQCRDAGVAFFFKQWGEWKPYRAMSEAEAHALYEPLAEGQHQDTHSRKCRVETVSFPSHPLPVGGPVDQLFKVGKKAAGRLLDGLEWNEFPTPHGATA